MEKTARAMGKALESHFEVNVLKVDMVQPDRDTGCGLRLSANIFSLRPFLPANIH